MTAFSADYTSVELTAINGAAPRTFVQGNLQGGKVRVNFSVYEADAVDTGKRIEMCRIPKGSRILPNSYIQADALGSSVTLGIGGGLAALDDDKYSAMTAMNTAGKMLTFNATVLADTPITEEYEPIFILTGGAAATGTIACVVFYIPPTD
jgi:hypothetical protein